LKGYEAKIFLKDRKNGLKLLQEYLEDPLALPKDISKIQVSSLKNIYCKVAWIFTRIIGQDSMETVPRLSLYILYFTVHEQAVFYWGKIISTEISSQLSNFKDTKKFYMSSYLIFSITFYHIFKGLNIGKRVNCYFDPIKMWYQAPWRQKDAHYFFEVYNEFVHVFNKMVFGGNTSRLSQEALIFLNKTGIVEEMEK
jgi:hypothetical protein